MGERCGWVLGDAAISLALRRVKLFGTKESEVVDGYCLDFAMRNVKLEDANDLL